MSEIEDICGSSNIIGFLNAIKNKMPIDKAKRKYKVFHKNNVILEKYHSFLDSTHIDLLTYKPVRSWSGVLVITVVMRPDKFSCPHNCYYCPNEPGQPRSYLSNEPAVARANEVKFDAVAQVYSRLCTLRKNGHKVDKLEIIVLGGTFSAYPRDYQKEFIRDLFFAANTYNIYLDLQKNLYAASYKERYSLLEEQRANEKASHKIIGISLETRPDHINKFEIMRLRSYGCTRVQLGVQHTDNTILDGVNRGHHVEHSIKAIKLLRCNGFKIDLHIMPDLPGSNPEMDKIMIQRILESPEFIPDYLKIYPCLDVDFTEIRNWKQSGRWKPYADSDNGEAITDVVLYAKILSKPYIRFNRIQRDFCEEREGVIGYNSKNIRSNFRQMLHDKMKLTGVTCKCIRCTEVKNNSIDVNQIRYKITSYKTIDGDEHFISSHCQSHLLGFVRLRINHNNRNIVYHHLYDYAFIRELHVYGGVVPTNEDGSKVQHLGIGKSLMSMAQSLAFLKGKNKIAVISGVGVRDYYRKLGFSYENQGNYMIKTIDNYEFIKLLTFSSIILMKLPNVEDIFCSTFKTVGFDLCKWFKYICACICCIFVSVFMMKFIR